MNALRRFFSVDGLGNSNPPSHCVYFAPTPPPEYYTVKTTLVVWIDYVQRTLAPAYPQAGTLARSERLS
jgi:hypothetical protein